MLRGSNMQKTTILLVRHGQSEANAGGIFTGHSGYPLSALGHAQAERTAEYIKANYPVDAVFSSDLPRAFQTAEHIALAFGLPIVTDARFREINGGAWERKLFDQLQDLYPDDYAVWKTDVGNARCTGGESVMELADRVYEGVCAVAEANPGKCIVIATHATPMRATIWKTADMSASEFQNVSWGGNCGISEFAYMGGELSAVKLNSVEHLTGMETKLPASI